MALGAQVRDVLRLVVFEGMKPTLLGVVIGVILALLLSLVLGRVLSNVIYGVGARDAATFAAVAGLMTLIGLLASAVPAFRATRVDPMRTLRDE
jgi:putative ABC transport system permease protein